MLQTIISEIHVVKNHVGCVLFMPLVLSAVLSFFRVSLMVPLVLLFALCHQLEDGRLVVWPCLMEYGPNLCKNEWIRHTLRTFLVFSHKPKKKLIEKH
jgi:hypothetical protein